MRDAAGAQPTNTGNILQVRATYVCVVLQVSGCCRCRVCTAIVCALLDYMEGREQSAVTLLPHVQVSAAVLHVLRLTAQGRGAPGRDCHASSPGCWLCRMVGSL